MPLPASGNSISLDQIHVELGENSGTTVALGDADVRALASDTSGAIGMDQFFGLSNSLNTSSVYKSVSWTGNGATGQDINTGFDMQTNHGLVIIRGSHLGYILDTVTGRGSGNNGANSSTKSTGFNHIDTRFVTPLNRDMTTWNTNGFTLKQDYNSSLNTNAGYPLIGHTFMVHTDFFDIVQYTGNSSSTQTVSHNLSTAPGWMIIRCETQSMDYMVWHKGSGSVTQGTLLMGAQSLARLGTVNNSDVWGNTAPTSSNFTVGPAFTSGDGDLRPNVDGKEYTAYLWADKAGVINSGSTSHTNGSTTAVDCGFSAGIDFVMIKSTDSNAGSSSGTPSFKQGWQVFDTVRGLTSGNDVAADWTYQSTPIFNTDYVDSASNGFVMQSDYPSGNYLYTAIAKAS